MTQQITALPTPPTRTDPNNFATRADAFLAALPTFGAEANQLASEVTTAALACAAAAQGVSLTAWVSGTTYAEGDVRYDTTDFKSYRRKTAGAGTTRPGLDGTNWALITGLGDVDTTSTQTISGDKTFSGTCAFSSTAAWSVGGTHIVKDASGRIGFGTSPFAWGTASFSGMDFALVAGIGGTAGVNLRANSYNDGTNDRAKATGAASAIAMTGAVLSFNVAPSVSAGAIQTFSEAWRTDASGNFLIGTTGGLAGERVTISGSAATHLMRWVHSSATNPNGPRMTYSGMSPNGVGNEFLYCDDSTTLRAAIRSNGGLANFSANDVNLSDERVKRDFKAAPSYYQRWRQIDFCTFLYRDQTDDERNLGVKAQQLASVCPELVDNSGFGEMPADGVPLKAVYQTDFAYATAVALQEAIENIEALKERLAALGG